MWTPRGGLVGLLCPLLRLASMAYGDSTSVGERQCEAGQRLLLGDLEGMEEESKHVMFVMGVGTASHTVAMFEIGDALRQRGHTFSWAGFREVSAWDKVHKFPFLVLGDGYLTRIMEMVGKSKDNKLMEAKPGLWETGKTFGKVVPASYEGQYAALLEFMTNSSARVDIKGRPMLPVDLLVCDNMAFACVDVALQLGKPYAIANHGFFFKGGEAPYILEPIEGDPDISPSFTRRFRNLVILPLVRLVAFRALSLTLAEIRERVAPHLPKLPAVSPFDRWDGVPILNTGSFFGWDEPRHLSPSMQLVGPIISERVRTPASLGRDLQAVYDSQRPGGVVYVALGSIAVLTEDRAWKLLYALRELRDDGVISGAIVSSRVDPPANLTKNGEGNGRQVLSSEWGIQWTAWAPQTSILAHPRTVAFLSHGGQESMYEALYWGVPVLVLPSLGDQWANGEKAKAAGVGDTLDKHHFTSQQVARRLRRLIEDPDDSVKHARRRMQTLIRLQSRGKAEAGATVIETLLLTGQRHLLTLPERAQPGWEYVWSHNLDVYGALVLVALVMLVALRRCLGGRGNA